MNISKLLAEESSTSSSTSTDSPKAAIVPPEKKNKPFHGDKHIVLPTTTTLGKRTFQYRIDHRFGRIGTERGAFGLDAGVVMNMGIAYGIIDGLDVGLSRTNSRKAWEFSAKYVPLRQEADQLLSLGVYASFDALRDFDVENRWSGNFMLLLLNIPLVGIFVKLLSVPPKYLLPIVTMVAFVGIYSISNSAFDLYFMVAFGVFGYFLRNSTRYIYVPLKGPVILFEYPGSAHVSTWLETIDESRTSKVVWSAVNQRDNMSSDPFGIEIAELMEAHGKGNKKIGLDRCALNLARSLEAQGIDLEPQHKIGPAASRMIEQGLASERLDEHRDIARVVR